MFLQIYTIDISLYDSLKLEAFEVVHLDGRVMHLCCDKLITPQLEKRISGEGMPIPNNQRVPMLDRSVSYLAF